MAIKDKTEHPHIDGDYDDFDSPGWIKIIKDSFIKFS